jgi:nicotinate dehydrogenase subunit B
VSASPTRSDYLQQQFGLLVLRGTDDEAELFLAIGEDGAVTAFNGHVDLGTGIRTALGQIVAEELDVPLASVRMILGDTERVPNQGATIASDTIQVTAIPLRQAAAQARHFLLAEAAAQLELPAADLTIEDGIIHGPAGSNRSVSYADLIKGRKFRLTLSGDAPLKPVEDYKIVGTPVARVDIPAKATGELVFVHDMRVPGMLHGRVVRPPYAGRDSGPFVGNSLVSVDERSIAHIPGIVAVVVIRDFVGIVAEREENAAKAALALKLVWRPWPDLPDLGNVEQALRANPSTPRKLLDKGDVDAAIAGAAVKMQRTYVWPYHMHGSIGPSCSVADYRDGMLRVWSGTQNPHVLRTDIARLMDMDEAAIEVVRMEAAGCYGRNCADDVGGDAALLSRAVGRPVRVQLTREQEHAWEPKGTAQVMDVNGGLTADGEVAAYDFATRYPSNGAPLLALLLTGMIPPVPAVFEMGDRTSIPPYEFDHMRVTVHDMPPIVRASWLRGVSALPNTFAHESYIDELAVEAGVDPIEFRLRYLKDPRAIDLVHAVAAKAGWVPKAGPSVPEADGDILRGRGFAYALYVHSKFPGYGAAWSAWVTDVEVNRQTGEVAVTRVVVGQDSGLMINPAGIRHQIEGNVIQSASRVLKEQVEFDRSAVVSKEWGAYPIISFPEVPEIDVLLVPRPDQPPKGSGESASVPSAAAIANAIYDATGVRFREPPFTPDRVLAGLRSEGLAAPPPPAKPRKRRRLFDLLGAASITALGMGAVALPLRPAIAPIAPPDPSVYSAATLARGKALAALGDCAVCHTAPNGAENAGGLALQTPFGTVYSTNITPDPETGIGTWSYPAFERAMREGIHRDGHHLYPAFPYTAFTRMTDADLQALYAHLMAQAPVRAEAPKTVLAFPFNLRPIMAGWNALYLKSGAYQPDPSRSAEWNRGAYLVEGLGHCSACHSPRNTLGAEKTGTAHLAGGTVDGWEAPPLTALSHAPIPWNEDDLFTYLSTGFSPRHGVAAGPMGPVVAELATAPVEDVRAMAVYLASFNEHGQTGAEQQARATALDARADAKIVPVSPGGARLYEGACAVCHQAQGPALFGVKPSLALNSNLHSAKPDNLIRVILGGIDRPATRDLGYMPGFKDSLNDQQVTDLLRYLRQRFAADKPAWDDLPGAVARIRTETAAH